MEMRRQLGAVLTILLLAAACGGGDSGDSTGSEDAAAETDSAADSAETDGPPSAADGEVPTGLPDECVETPFEIEVDATAIDGLDGPFTVETAIAKPQPIVPNPDQGAEGGDEQTQAEFLEALDEAKLLAAETDLLLYAIWIADFGFDASDIAFLGGPDPEPGGTVFGLTIVPTRESGFMQGDTIGGEDEIEYDTFTTFAPMGSYMLTDLAPEAFVLYSGIAPGQAEILFLDDAWICVRWQDSASTRGPDGDLSVSGVILAELTAREELPFN